MKVFSFLLKAGVPRLGALVLVAFGAGMLGGAVVTGIAGGQQSGAKVTATEVAGGGMSDPGKGGAEPVLFSDQSSQHYGSNPDGRLDPSTPEFASWLKNKTAEVESLVQSPRLPVSIKTYLKDFMDANELIKELATETDFGLSTWRPERRFLDSICAPLRGDRMSSENGWSDSYFWDLCDPPGYFYQGTSPDFSIYWIRNRLGPEDKYYEGHFPLPLVQALQEWQYSFRSVLRGYLSKPSNLRGIYDLERAGLISAAAELSPEVRNLVANRLRRIAEVFAVARGACGRASCKATPVDFSVAENRFDTDQFVGTSPMSDLVSYDSFELWEIRSLEFAARRYTEGGAPLVTEYIAIANDAAAILDVSKSQ